MELFQVELTGFKKFKDRSTLKTRGKILAILGPNEAGKSSLLRALSLLGSNEAYAVNERSRGLKENYPLVKATYLLSDEDREAAGISVGTWYEIIKYPDGKRAWTIRPSPPHRNYSHRSRVVARARNLPKGSLAFVTQIDDDLYTDTISFFERFFGNSKELLPEVKQQLADLASRWETVSGVDAPQKVRDFDATLNAAIKVEAAKSQHILAGEELWDRMPEFVLFGAEDRNLRPSYTFSELSGAIPSALANLAKVAELDISTLISVAIQNPNDPEFDTIMERANAALQRNFQAAWKQSKVSVVLAHREQSLLVQVYNNDRSRTDFAQRSDGLRQFVALRCFTASRGSDNFVLLIDEVEQHLHYDAQADLVQMLAGQTVASKVIYTTHSLGCLPEDLGNGVRLIIPTERDGDWSQIENKFWMLREKEEAAFSPILMGMGAGTMAFFPTRAAVLVEGPSDSILLPTMFREALEKASIGVQFVHGLSESGNICLPLLNSTGTQVCYLLDNDRGGQKLTEQLFNRGVASDRVFRWPALKGDAELEDFLDPTLLAEAVSNLAKQHHGIENLVLAAELPKVGKWDFIERACVEAGLKPLQKVPVAYEILEILDFAPAQRAVDPKRFASFKTFAQKVIDKVHERST